MDSNLKLRGGELLKCEVLLIDDDREFAEAFRLSFQTDDLEISWVSTGAQAISRYRLNPHHFSLVVIDYKLPDHSGVEIAQHLRRLNPDQEILFVTGFQRIDYYAEMLETGSTGFFFKGSPSETIAEKISTAIARHLSKRRLLGNDYEPTSAELEMRQSGVIGKSKGLYDAFKQSQRYAAGPDPVMLVGESGAGKEVIAQAMVPKGKQIITINCAGFTGKENMLESELFGHVKGAFTGADKDSPGLILKAHNNVLFLDELHQLSMVAQTKLLRFLETLKFRRIGDSSGRQISVSFKLITAVQPDIKERVEQQRFLTDLLGRVGVLVVKIPPLRERPDDIEPLCMAFQADFNSQRPPNDRKQFHLSTIEAMKTM